MWGRSSIPVGTVPTAYVKCRDLGIYRGFFEIHCGCLQSRERFLVLGTREKVIVRATVILIFLKGVG